MRQRKARPLETSRFTVSNFSPAARSTKKHAYLPYRGANPFWLYLVPLRLVSIFLDVGRVEISCGLLPTRFLLILLPNCITVKKVIFQVQF